MSSLSPGSIFAAPGRTGQGMLLALLLLTCVALLPRLYAALDYGRDWYAPGSFTLINFDEAGSCRAALEGFSYSPFVGWQTLALAQVLDVVPTRDIKGKARAVKSFCHGEAHVRVARIYSAVLGALTIVVLAGLALLLFPAQPGIAITAGMLLALSGWHISESMVGTVDAASTFFVYLFLLSGIWAFARGGWRYLVALLLIIPAVWTKYWVFALTSLAAVVPLALCRSVFAGITRARILVLLCAFAALFALVSNPALADPLMYVAPLLFYLLVPWRRLSTVARLVFVCAPWLAPLAMQIDSFVAFSSGGLQGRFGTDYGAIAWNKWLRNALNIPIVLLIGMGLPAGMAALAGAWHVCKRQTFDRSWLALLPLLAFALYMFFLAPVTYYRHYLPLLPFACLLAAVGIYALPKRTRYPMLALALLWQACLAWDLVSDYRFDPRRALPQWYAQHQPQRVLTSYYVNPPTAPGITHRLFLPTDPARDAALLRRADTLILSENWYDTAFANELNGPLIDDPLRLIKTTLEASNFYRAALRDEHPMLRKRAHFSAPRFMPEMQLHYAYYGSFTQFVGDIVVFEITP